MKQTYDITASYLENYERGPRLDDPPDVPPTPLKKFLGLPVHSRLGIAAGLLLNSNWLLGYAAQGFDLLTYKTVRSRARECYPPPNWVFVDADDSDGPVYATDKLPTDPTDISSAVCFGMPSMPPEEWREDVSRCKVGLGEGQLLIVSVVASPEPGWSASQLASDYAQCAAWAVEAGADVIEANFSCPNVCSAEGQIYLDADLSGNVSTTIRDAIGKTPLLLKVATFPAGNSMRDFMRAVSTTANGVTLVNGISRPVLHRDGRPVFGADYVKAGVLGRIIHEPSVASVRQARAIVNAENLNLAIAAVGGTSTTNDLADFFNADADAVLLGSAPMFLPHFARDVKQSHPEW
jgi:dihydroorotate dehydrogenase (NAD+) catalytic subunit